MQIAQRTAHLNRLFEYYYKHHVSVPDNLFDEYTELCELIDVLGIDVEYLDKVSRRKYLKSTRLKKYVEFILKKPCIFLTLTFTDDSLCLHNVYRAQKVRDYLYSQSEYFILNKDFGSINGREHYHCIIQADNVDYSKYTLGAINGLRCYTNISSAYALRRYISKLTNHAIKHGTRGSRVYISKNLKKVLNNS